eukprot:9648886-Heterocapsa_arctica.AAC.1
MEEQDRALEQRVEELRAMRQLRRRRRCACGVSVVEEAAAYRETFLAVEARRGRGSGAGLTSH